MIRCAIYTRKSSEEGLEQFFNSLDAQREACQAYIESQRYEGWRALKTHYDDGGYSGGNIERPALKTLLADIDAGRIDTVVVYKVDRLTRSLSDFAKIIQIFETRKVSFVSVTQQFNTTSSMGRLTLNVLLSFAQFEREVTGERIRDKIAASKRKGMWMGGTVPLGYDLKDRKLIINAEEAQLVREIYQRYLELRCVSKLKIDLDRRCIVSKKRISQGGRKSGGTPYSRGALYELLQNRIYLGEVTHRGQSFQGEHEGIISREVWEKVQAQLKTNAQARRTGLSASNPSLLVGLIYDDQGNRFTPSHAVKNERRYRYYVSQAVNGRSCANQSKPNRIPAHEIESLVWSQLKAFVCSPHAVFDAFAAGQPAIGKKLIAASKRQANFLKSASPTEAREFLHAIVAKILIYDRHLEILVDKKALRGILLGTNLKSDSGSGGVSQRPPSGDLLKLTVQAELKRCGGEVRLIVSPNSAEDSPNRTAPSLLKAIARAHEWYESLLRGQVNGRRAIARITGLDERYVSRILECAFLAPDIVEALLSGRQSPDLTLEKLCNASALDWSEQRKRLGMWS